MISCFNSNHHMETLALSFFFLFFFFTHTTSNNCSLSSCLPTEPQVRFPFHLTGRQPGRCGLPNFNLYCNTNNQTTLELRSGQLVPVKRISYTEQTVVIDPQFCIPNRINDFTLFGTPFLNLFLYSYTFVNCSSQYPGSMYPAVRFDCLSGPNYTVFAMPTDYTGRDMMPASCRNISQIWIPVPVSRYRDLSVDEIELRWFMPECSSCEFNGGTCGTSSSGDPYTVVCYRGHSRGLPRSAKYGIILGLGIPALLCLIGLIYFTNKKVRAQNQSRDQGIDISSITITPQPILLMGLDGPTIESYPKTVLGESRRLPKPNDGTCPICLSDYQPKEELRTIPDCNHYFHLECIDEWLRLNATCPLCRNSPESSNVTPCTSISSSASTSTHATSSP